MYFSVIYLITQKFISERANPRLQVFFFFLKHVLNFKWKVVSSPRLFTSISNSDFLEFINAEILLALYWYLYWWGFHPEPRVFMSVWLLETLLCLGRKKQKENRPYLSPNKKASDFLWEFNVHVLVGLKSFTWNILICALLYLISIKRKDMTSLHSNSLFNIVGELRLISHAVVGF